MAAIGDSEKVLPCLLDRLTDDRPDNKRPGSGSEVLSSAQYRKAVYRDIEWLLNTTARSSQVEPEIYESESVRASVINFGVPDLTGRSAGGVDPRLLEQNIMAAFRAFEPRVPPDALRITVEKQEGKLDQRAVRIEIRGELWSQPVPEPLMLTAVVDRVTGQCEVRE